MNNFLRIFAAVFSLASICSCSAPVKEKNTQIEVDELYFAHDPEPVKGRMDVYTSMARTVKYNVDVVTQNMNKKVFSIDAGSSPKDVIRKVLNVKAGKESPLYDSLRALDFAVIYALAHLSDSRAYIDANMYAKTSQNLALAAIKAHKNALFAGKKIKEIERLMDKERKTLGELNKKLERVGSLTKNDLEYKKGLEVALLKLSEIRNNWISDEIEYARLVKSGNGKAELEGRRFYELEDFDAKMKVKQFQSSAFRNRNEFALSKELNRSYAYSEVEANLLKKYPEVERLEINGYDVKDPIYAEELENRAYKTADGLVNAVMEYQVAKKAEEKKYLRAKAFDELGIAVFTQVEVAFNVVQITSLDAEAISAKAQALRKEVKQAEKGYRLSSAQKIYLLNLKISLLETESRESQVLAERAVAIRALYFYAGFSPFNKTLLRADIKDIVTSLKIGFNQDMVEMLAAVPGQEKEDKRIENSWAKQDGWLEKLMDGKKEQKRVITLPNKPMGDFDLYDGEEYNKLKNMQLGSYREPENANLEWAMLKELYPEFHDYKPVIEKTTVSKKAMYRLVIKSEDGGFRDVCNKLRRDRVECLLR